MSDDVSKFAGLLLLGVMVGIGFYSLVSTTRAIKSACTAIERIATVLEERK